MPSDAGRGFPVEGGPTKHLHRPNTGPPRDVGLHQAKCRPPWQSVAAVVKGGDG